MNHAYFVKTLSSFLSIHPKKTTKKDLQLVAEGLNVFYFLVLFKNSGILMSFSGTLLSGLFGL